MRKDEKRVADLSCPAVAGEFDAVKYWKTRIQPFAILALSALGVVALRIFASTRGGEGAKIAKRFSVF